MTFFQFATCTSPIMHLIYSAKFGMSVVFNSSWNSCINTQEKRKTKTMQSFGGKIRCIIGDVQVANAKTPETLHISRFLYSRGWQVHVFVSTLWQCKRSIRELKQWTLLRSRTSGRLRLVWIKYSVCGPKSED